MATHRHRGRRWLASVAGLSLVASGLGLGGAAAAPAAPLPTQPETGAAADVEPEVREALADDGRADFWVRFADRPDSAQFRSITDWDARGQAVYDALTKTAERSQAEVRAQLDDEGVAYQAFWATNAIRISAGDAALVSELSLADGVEGIYAPRVYEVPDDQVEKGPAEIAPNAVEWGVADINADDVWDTYGISGEGITVASIDTGAQYDHPALVDQYRGNNGDGTFDHDYNWFDAAGTSPGQPSDTNGHGSHVTGTMVGDDGGDNQIGVAPGATWIAANGCCPSDEALYSSGQWMLAPTRLDGSDPDPSKRPHVVNNSWGTQTPSNDPFMEDVILAWTDAGIFGVFANGNSGSFGCNSSGAPGSLVASYSVGNYNIDHGLSPTSGRGYGEDGEIKPNIAAPGTNVRSSVPGNGYANYSGTSMASPHVAGAVALLWSAAPALAGDVEGTRALLDGTAVDTAFLDCGGTLEDNNGFGEGRLDALAMMENAPIGDTGTIEGTVTDADTGEPIAGATVEVDGELDRSLTTDAEGEFSALLPVGDYEVSVSAFGYGTDSASVTIEQDETTTQDFTLEAAPSATVSGTVTDGSGRGWPLYAAILVDGTPLSTYTDPETGEYSVQVPTGATYTVQAVVQYPGYVTASQEVTVDGDEVVDFEVPVDSTSCTAPGYTYNVQGVTESFDGTEAPEGWTVEDYEGNGQVWRFDNPDGRENLTGGEGNFAIMDSDYYGSGGVQNTGLISPSVDMSELTDPAVGFKQDLNYLGGETYAVEYSIDGGATWSTVVSYAQDLRGPREEFLQLPADAAGESDVKVRFLAADVTWDWWWQVDDVFIGNRACEPTDGGGLVVGNVYDANTGDGIVGARVTNDDAPETDSATTVATPEDENLDDGFYWMFVAEEGTHPFTAEARNYSSQTQDVAVEENDAVRADFELGAAFLTWDPESIETHVLLGESQTEELVVTNEGTGTAEVEFREVPGDFALLRADGSTMTAQEVMESEGAPVVSIDAPTSFAASGASGDAVQPQFGTADEPWTGLGNYPAVVMDNRVVNVDGTWFSVGGTNGSASYDTVARYDNEAMAWTEVAPLPSPRSAVAAGSAGGQVVVSGGWVEAGVTGQTLVYDPAGDTWTEMADAPFSFSAAGQAVADGKLYVVGGCTTSSCTPMSNDVAAYDVATDTWEQLADYPIAAAFASCAGIDGSVYCTGGNDGAAASADTYVYDAAADTWTEVATAPVDSWASQYAGANGMLIVNGGVQGGDITNATLAYDPAADEWTSLPASNQALYRGGAACGFARVGGSVANFDAVATGEYLPGFDECGDGGAGADVEWLELSTYEATLAPGESVTVDVTTDGDVAQPGTYTAAVRIVSNAPGSAPEVPVTMQVDPPLAWGKLQGTVSGESCEGELSPLAGASVDITPSEQEHPGWFQTTDEDGFYAQWFDTRVGAVEVIAAKDGYRPESADVSVPRGETVTEDFELLDAECESPDPGPVHPEVIRLAGENRYATAVEVSAFHDPGVDTVFLATGQDYPDALTASAKAGSLGVPVLLTRSDLLVGVTADELERLQPGRVVILGDENSIDANVAAAVQATVGAGVTVERWAGENRYATAAVISATFESSEVVYIATGQDFPDALAGSARAGALDAPVLLVREDLVPSATRAELERLDPDTIRVLGDESSISEEVATVLAGFGAVERIAGDDRYATAVEISGDYPTAETTFLSNGTKWPDAVTAAALAGHLEAPLLLVKQDSVPSVTWAELERLQPATIHVMGDEESVSEEVVDQLLTLE